MGDPDRDLIRKLLRQADEIHKDLAERIDDLRDEVRSQNEGIMRIIDRLGPADPPNWND